MASHPFSVNIDGKQEFTQARKDRAITQARKVAEGNPTAEVSVTRGDEIVWSTTESREVPPAPPASDPPEHGASITSSGHFQGPVVGTQGGILLVNGEEILFPTAEQAREAKQAILDGSTTIDKVRAVAAELATVEVIGSIGGASASAIDASYKAAWKTLTPEGAKQPTDEVAAKLREAQRKAHEGLHAPRSTSSSSAKPKAEPGPVPAGHVAIPVRGRTLLATVQGVPTPRGVKVDAEFSRVFVTEEGAQKLVNALRAVVSAEGTKEHVAWLLESLISHVRCAYPTTTDPGNTVNVRAVNALLASKKSWDAQYRASDGSPVYLVGKDLLSARAVLKVVPEVKVGAA